MHRHSILLLALLATLPGVHSFGSLQYLRPGGAQVPGPYTAMMHEDLTPVNAGVDLGVEGAHAPQLTYNGGELEVSVVDGKVKVRQNPKVLAPPPGAANLHRRQGHQIPVHEWPARSRVDGPVHAGGGDELARRQSEPAE